MIQASSKVQGSKATARSCSHPSQSRPLWLRFSSFISKKRIKNLPCRVREMAHLIKHLPGKHVDLTWWCGSEIPRLGRQRHEDHQDSLASQSSYQSQSALDSVTDSASKNKVCS